MSDLCSQCAALCCRYFALPIDNPTTARDFEDIRWYLCHENIVVFIEKRQWYVGIMNRCKHLMPDNRCGIYETRPTVCREYSTDNCDWHGGEYDFSQLFTSAEQLHEYAQAKLRKRRERRQKKTGTTRAKWTARELRVVANGKGNGKNESNGGNGKHVSLPVFRD